MIQTGDDLYAIRDPKASQGTDPYQITIQFTNPQKAGAVCRLERKDEAEKNFTTQGDLVSIFGKETVTLQDTQVIYRLCTGSNKLPRKPTQAEAARGDGQGYIIKIYDPSESPDSIPWTTLSYDFLHK